MFYFFQIGWMYLLVLNRFGDGGGGVWKMISACLALPLSYFWYEPEATLNWMVVAFCMSVSHYPVEWSLSPCPLILPLHLTCATSLSVILPPFSVSCGISHLWLCTGVSVSLCSCTLCKCVTVVVFPACECLRLVCMHKSTHACTYLHAIILTVRAIAPPSPTIKRILILSGLTVPSNERWGGVGSTLNGLAFCGTLWFKGSQRRVDKHTKPSLRGQTAAKRWKDEGGEENNVVGLFLLTLSCM